VTAAREARLMGFTGCVCATAEQVAVINQGYAAV
jgi:citrate lyase beta subunit